MLYAGQRAILTTMHGKQRAIARPLRVATGLAVQVTDAVDTDLLGSFTGERPRLSDARSTVLAKARLGMEATGCPIGVANEGSFAPHPLVPFLSAGYEVIAFVDDARGFSLVETLVSEATNHAHFDERDGQELDRWLARVHFPSHALVVRPRTPTADAAVAKGIRSHESLDAALRVARRLSADGHALIETDMRAHMNPLRMRAIGAAAVVLARRLACRCPQCQLPGFGRVDTVRGLPCAVCGSATALVREERWGCVRCSHSEHRPRADTRRSADPGECPQCNP